MDELVAKYGWKKVAIALVGIGLLGIAFVIMSFSSLDREATEAQKARNSQNASNTGDTNVSIYRGGGDLIKNYETQFYSISYPAALVLSELAPGTDSLSAIKLTEETTNTSIEIQVLRDAGRLSELSQVYDSLGYSRQEVTLPAGPAVEYSGMVAGSEVHQKVVFITKEGRLIRFLGSYPGESANQSIEQLFSDMYLSIQ